MSERGGALRPPLRLALLAFILSLGFMQPGFRLSGFLLVPSDLIYVPLALLALAAATSGRLRPFWMPGFILLIFYLAALALAAIAADDWARAAAKLLGQLYLVSLPVLAVWLIDDEAMLRAALIAWLAGAAIAVSAGVAALLLFAFAPDVPLLAPLLSGYGSLPPGDYPRLTATFRNANMLCNYLTASLLILFAARHEGWISRAAFILFCAAALAVASFTISPGLAGLSAGAGIWFHRMLKSRAPRIAGLLLAGSLVFASCFLLAAAVTFFPHGGAEPLFLIPHAEMRVFPSIRVLIWSEALAGFREAPLLGRGLGTAPVDVDYLAPSGQAQSHRDAHNSFLSIASQAGLIGLAAFLALLGWAFRQAICSRPTALALGVGFAAGMGIHGLTGSFEDARHLWLLLGLFLAALRLQRRHAGHAGRGPSG
ncbi:MAG: O-antigen ligase family protein [Sphingomonadaceae bacterium]